MNAYSLDLRQRVVSAYEKGEGTIVDLADRFNVGQTFLKKMLRQQRETGSLERLPQRAGAKRALASEHQKWLAKVIKEQPDATLRELQDALAEEQHVEVSLPTLCRALQILRLPLKKSRRSPRRGTITKEVGSGARSNRLPTRG